jgi:senataxin
MANFYFPTLHVALQIYISFFCTDFVDVLRCLLFLIKRLNNNLWEREGPEFPQVVFDAVKDNPSFSHLLQSIDSVGDRPWFISWFPEYLQTLYDLPIYADVLAKIIDFMCEELQHERFQEARPTIMTAATRVSIFFDQWMLLY